jgi:hypothetical protein
VRRPAAMEVKLEWIATRTAVCECGTRLYGWLGEVLDLREDGGQLHNDDRDVST